MSDVDSAGKSNVFGRFMRRIYLGREMGNRSFADGKAKEAGAFSGRSKFSYPNA